MAALTRHAFLGGALLRSSPILSRTTMLVIPARGKKDKKPPQKPKKKASVDSVMASIEAKGFLRPYKPYQPPADVSERLNQICQSEGLSSQDETRLDDLLVKFKLLAKCADQFSHSVTNSRLVEMETIGDVRDYYHTPVFTTTPLEALQNMELPPNLHVQQEYHRFHPDTDTMFDGKSAYPQNATLVTGLKYKDRYPGHVPEKPWPEKVESIFDRD